jgi:hypothetical protein
VIDLDHRLKPKKLLNIIASERALGIPDEEISGIPIRYYW